MRNRQKALAYEDPLREILTIIACLLVALLTAALVGPYFVDWSAQRGLIEQRLSQATGARVRIAGSIDLKLLPTPSLRVENLSAASRTPGGPSLRARRADFELAVAPLLRGRIQFLRADIEAPHVRLPLGPHGLLSLPGAPRELPMKLEFERLRLHDATITFDRGGAPDWSLRHIDLEAQAASLDGPFSGSGRVRRPSGDLSFRFSTGAREGARLRVQMSLSSPASTQSVRFQGALSFTPAAGAATKISYAGSAALEGMAPMRGISDVPWRIAGHLAADGDGAKITAGQIRIGDVRGQLSAKARGSMRFGPNPQIQAALKAPQIDLDRFLASQGPHAAQAWMNAIDADLSDASLADRSPWPIALSLAAPAVTLGGQTLTGTKVNIVLKQGAPIQVKATAAGPGESHLAVNGTLETGAAAVLRGHVDAGARDAARFANWISPRFPDFAARLRALPFRALGVAGELDLSAASFALRHLVLNADRTLLRGTAAYTGALGSQRPRLFAALRSNALDLDSLPDLAGPASSATGMDLALSLDARAVRLARFGQGMIDAGRIDVQLARTGSVLRLKKLTLSNVGGADVSATGGADDKTARLDATLDASRLADLAALVNRVAPGPLASAFATRATALSPARLTLHIRAARGKSGTYRPISVSLTGKARDVRISADLRPGAKNPKVMGLELGLNGPDSSIMLRQLGLETLPIADTGAGRIEANLRGRLDQRLTAHIDASLAGADLTFQGQIAHALTHPSARGAFKVKSGDAAPLLRLLTLVLPDVSQGLPASFNSDLEADAAGLSLSSIAGEVGGAQVAGSLGVRATNDGPLVAGALSVDRMSLATLASLAFGPGQAVRPGALWSSVKLAPGLADPPVTDVALSIGRFALAPGWTASKAALRLKIAPGLVSLDDMDMKLDQGNLSGSLALRRNGPAAAIAGAISVDRLAIDRPLFAGRLAGRAKFTATGDSAYALAGGLAGSGAVTVSNLTIAGADPGALTRVVAMSDKKGFTIDQQSIVNALSAELAKGPLRLGARAFDLSAAGGMVRLASQRAGSNAAHDTQADISLAIDLRAQRMRERIRLSNEAAPEDWPVPTPPHIAIVLKESLSGGAPSRSIEAGEAVSDLSARAIAHETARISALEADIRERAFFDRRLKGLRFMRKRERQEAAYEAQQAAKLARARAAELAKRAKTAAKAGVEAARHGKSESQKPADLSFGFSPLVPPPSPPPPPAGFGPDPLSAGPY